MKKSSTILYLLVLCISLQAQAQPALPVNEPDHNKPQLFSSLPERIVVNMNNLTRSLTASPGETVSLNLSADQAFTFTGTLTSSASKYDDAMQCVTIRSTNYNGALLSFSRIRETDGSTRYTGRIVSLQHGDLFDLIYDNDKYIFIKKNFYDLINE